MYENNKHSVHGNNIVCTKFAFTDAKKVSSLFTMNDLNQLIQCPTRVTCSTSTVIDHVLDSFPSSVSQKGVINVGLSDHQRFFFVHEEFLNLKQVAFTST